MNKQERITNINLLELQNNFWVKQIIMFDDYFKNDVKTTAPSALTSKHLSNELEKTISAFNEKINYNNRAIAVLNDAHINLESINIHKIQELEQYF